MKLLILILLVSLSLSVQASVKVGIVSIQKVMLEIKEGKSADKTLTKAHKSMQKQLTAEENKIRKLQETFQKQSKVLSDSAKAKKAGEIQQLMAKTRKMAQDFRKKIQKQEAELKKPIIDKLKPIINSISKSEKLALTFEATNTPVFAQDKVDITKKVIKAYDKKYSK